MGSDLYLIAEDFPSLDLASTAAKLAVRLLEKDSGYAGERDLGSLADYVAGLCEIPEDSPHGCALLKARVID
jgi:hypothetical protein